MGSRAWWLVPVAVTVALVAPGFNTRSAPTNDEVVVERIGGQTRFHTAAMLADRYEPGVGTVFVSRHDDFADALAGGPAAAAVGGPLLLVTRTEVPEVTAEALTRLEPRDIVILGGTAAISSAVEEELSRFARGRVDRWAGDDRFGTAARVAEETHPEGADAVLIATGTVFADGVAGSAAAARVDAPLLLVSRHSLPEATRKALQRLAPQRAFVLGGPEAISDQVLDEIRTVTGRADRLAGADRDETAAKIALALFDGSARTAYVATGADFPDALAGGPSAAGQGAPVLLVTRSSAQAVRVIEELGTPCVVILGGVHAVNDEREAEIRNARPGEPCEPDTAPTPSPDPTTTPTPDPTSTPTPDPTSTPTPDPTSTPTPDPTSTPTSNPTSTPTGTVAPVATWALGRVSAH